MLRLLFVDDEPCVLAGLKRSLRPLRHEWEVEFVDSGEKALEAFQDRQFDVVVTDVRMPGMDGPQLLRVLERQYPAVVRIVLSGQSAEEEILRTVGPAHQFLAKPCDTATLRDAIDRACALQKVVCDPVVRKLVAQVNTLPSLPRLFEELVAELSSKDCSMQQVGEIIATDVAMTAKVLQLVNSSFFGLGQRITSPGQAVALLGQSTIKALVLGVGVFSQFEKSNLKGLCLDAFVQHCAAVGILAARIGASESKDGNLVSDAQLAGMMHDIGKLVLSASGITQYEEVRRETKENDTELWKVERQRFGVCHSEIGGYLLGLWGLPTPVVEAVAFHHEPSRSAATGFSPLAAVHFANQWYRATEEQQRSRQVSLDPKFAARSGITQRIGAWCDIAEKTDDKR